MNPTRVLWLNRNGALRCHALFPATYFYAVDWWRRSILENQGCVSVDERRESQLRLLAVQHHIADPESPGLRFKELGFGSLGLAN